MPQPKSHLPRSDDLSGTWKFLEDGISRIMEHTDNGLTFQKYMELYTVIYNFCTVNKTPSGDHPKILSTGRARGAYLMGADLYKNLQTYLETHLKRIQEESANYSGVDFLKFYARQWTQYTAAAGYVHRVFKYLNRHWVKREIDEGRKSVYDVYTLCLVCWRSELFLATLPQLQSDVMQLIEDQRNGETIETSLLKTIIGSFVSLGLNESELSKASLEVYAASFQTPFIESTKLYYQKESATYLAENSVVDYMKKAEQRLNEEDARIDMYLHSSTRPVLMAAAESVLTEAHAPLMHEEFQSLLENLRISDLQRLYSLLSKVMDGLTPIRQKFELHVKRAGLEAIEKRVADLPASESIKDSLDAKVYVDTLLQVYKQYRNLVETAFTNDTEFEKSLDNAAREFVNRNKVCHTSSSNSPELLAKYCDSLLKKSAKNTEQDLSHKASTLIAQMTIFKYIEDKDVFQKFYTRNLAKRLVNATSASDDHEATMIAKLKEACGFEYTNKLQRMFQDMGLSKDLNQEFLESQNNANKTTASTKKNDLDFSILVLGTSSWPLQLPSTTFNIPDEILNLHNSFQQFYSNKHSGRKLNWLFHHSKVEVKANFLKHSKIGYTFQVSTYQIGILLAFNHSLSHTYEELQSITGLNKETLDGNLNIFLKARVLTSDKGSEVASFPGARFSLNMDFKSKKIRVNLNLPIRAEVRAEAVETHKTVEEDRKMLIQSVIVRIMKTRKQLKHVALMQETISQVKGRFTPKVVDIKKCIDILIEKDYLERDEVEKDAYKYLA